MSGGRATTRAPENGPPTIRAGVPAISTVMMRACNVLFEDLARERLDRPVREWSSRLEAGHVAALFPCGGICWRALKLTEKVL